MRHYIFTSVALSLFLTCNPNQYTYVLCYNYCDCIREKHNSKTVLSLKVYGEHITLRAYFKINSKGGIFLYAKPGDPNLGLYLRCTNTEELHCPVHNLT